MRNKEKVKGLDSSLVKHLSKEERELYNWLKKYEKENIKKITSNDNPNGGAKAMISLVIPSIFETKAAVLDIKDNINDIRISFAILIALFGAIGVSIAISAIKFVFF